MVGVGCRSTKGFGISGFVLKRHGDFDLEDVHKTAGLPHNPPSVFSYESLLYSLFPILPDKQFQRGS